MIRATHAAAALAVLVLVAGSAAHAQTGPQGGGLWIGAGLGYGVAWPSCQGCPTDHRGGLATFLKLGASLRPNLRLGGELNLWMKHASGLTQEMGNLSAALYWYPGGGAAFAKGGAGLALTHFSGGAGNPAGSTGFGVVAGAGYDWRLARHVSLTPVVNLYLGWTGEEKQGGAVIGRGLRHAILDAGLGITVH